jgi:hypothetical protein
MFRALVSPHGGLEMEGHTLGARVGESDRPRATRLIKVPLNPSLTRSTENRCKNTLFRGCAGCA